MPAELLDQLDAYGRFLETQTGQSLRPPTAPSADPPTSSPLHAIGRPIHSRRPVWTAAAAFLVALAGVVGAVAIVRHTPAAVVDEPTDPSGGLFVLPDPDAGYTVSGGSVEGVPDFVTAETVVGLVGRADGSGYVDLVQVVVGLDLTQPVEDGTGSTVPAPRSHAATTPGGRSVQVLDDPSFGIVQVVSGSGSTAISFLALEGHLDDVLAVVDDVAIQYDVNAAVIGTATASFRRSSVSIRMG